MGPGANSLNLLDGKDPAAAPVVRVLQAHQPGPHQVLVGRPNLTFKLGDVEDAVIAFEHSVGDAAEHGRAARLEIVNVAAGLAEQLVAGLRVRLDANLVGHGA